VGNSQEDVVFLLGELYLCLAQAGPVGEIALGTVADMAPLTDENRILVTNGLRLFKTSGGRPGLRELTKLVGLDDGQVSFTWKDYRQDGKTKVMTLAADEFIRRFLQHTVPDGFHRIRHIGLLANRHRTAKLALCRDLLAALPPPDPQPPRRWQDRLRALTGHDIEVCPGCGGRGSLVFKIRGHGLFTECCRNEHDHCDYTHEGLLKGQVP